MPEAIARLFCTDLVSRYSKSLAAMSLLRIVARDAT